MAYSTSNPPKLFAQAGGGDVRHWYYASTDVHTDVDAADYFTNGWALGMRVGDVVDVVKTTATVGLTRHVVSAATVGGAVTIAPAILA